MEDDAPLLEVTIPPVVNYCNFCLPSESIAPRDPQLSYFESGFAPKLYHQILMRSGFKKTIDITRASIIIGSNKAEKAHRTLLPQQRIEHYLHTFKIGSKVGMHAMMTIYGHSFGRMPGFYPTTFLLPQERDQFEAYRKTEHVWIVKPSNPTPEEGIYISRTLDADAFNEKNAIVQEYIQNPLLVNGFKFDLRCYVAVTSLDPLRVYVYNDGIVRFAATNYEESSEDFTRFSAHLPNVSATRKKKLTKPREKRQHKSKWSHDQLWAHLETTGLDSAAIRSNIDDAVATVFIAARPQLIRQSNHRFSIELYGVDVLIDSLGGIHILGINVSPALGVKSSIDVDVKSALVRDFLNISLIPMGGFAQTSLELEMEVGVHQRLKEYVAISEYEETERRRNGWRRCFPSIEYEQTHGPVPNETHLDSVLRVWLSMDSNSKAKFAEKRAKSLERFTKSIATYTKLCRI